MESMSKLKPMMNIIHYWRKKNLLKRIEKVENQEDITNYYLENGELVFQYYDQKKNPEFMKKSERVKILKNL